MHFPTNRFKNRGCDLRRGLILFLGLNLTFITSSGIAASLGAIYFEESSGHYTYMDDAFLGTAEPLYARGKHLIGNQCHSGGCLKVSLGGRDDLAIYGMSGGWTADFTLEQPANVQMSFMFRVRQLRDYEKEEYTDVLIAVDGRLVGMNGQDYIMRIRGDGNGGNNIDSGWLSATIDLGYHGTGTHSLTVGGYNNRKTAKLEYSAIWFDAIRLDSTDGSDQPATVADKVQFGVLGDFGVDNAQQAELDQQMDQWNIDFIVTVGDNRYFDLSMDDAVGKYHCNFLTDINGGSNCPAGLNPINAFFPVPGNHDYNDGGGVSEYLDYFKLPGTGIATSGTSGSELYYDYIKGPVHFFALDSEGTDLELQKTWLQQALAKSNSPWKVVVVHHPPYSSSSYHGSNPSMQWPFADWGADVVLSGHDHHYERIERDGVVYIVNGLGGRTPYDLGTPVTGSLIRYNADFGAQRITATDTTMTFEFINRTGQLVDYRMISR